MAANTQLTGLDRFLRVIYGRETGLAELLDELGFEQAQSRWLQDERMAELAAALVECLRKRLTRGELDLWFRVLNRRYGLDGEPGAALEQTARALNVAVEQASKAEADALTRCRAKTTLQALRQDLHRIALDQLSQHGEQPARDDVAGKLNRLGDLHAALDLARMDYEAKRAEVLKNVQAELDALEAEYQPLLDAAEENLSTLETEIKNDVLLARQSVTTGLYQAIYMKGRVSWDTEGIDHYARQHPDVLQYRKEGNPSVTLRTASKRGQ